MPPHKLFSHDIRPQPMRKRSISDTHLNLVRSAFVHSRSTNIEDVLDCKSRSDYPDIEERRAEEEEYDSEEEHHPHRRWSGGSSDSDSNNLSPTIRKRKRGLISFSFSKLVDATMSMRRRHSRHPTDPRQLIVAIRNRDIERVRHVLETYPVDVNGCNPKGVTALHEAALDGQCDIVQLLLQHNAQLDQEDDDGLTCLDYAVFGGHFECAQYLIENGAITSNVRDGMQTYFT